MKTVGPIVGIGLKIGGAEIARPLKFRVERWVNNGEEYG